MNAAPQHLLAAISRMASRVNQSVHRRIRGVHLSTREALHIVSSFVEARHRAQPARVKTASAGYLSGSCQRSNGVVPRAQLLTVSQA